VHFSVEATPLRMRTTYGGVSAYGFGGTNVHVQMKIDINDTISPPPKLYLHQNFFSFWPGGGGQIQYKAEPDRYYSILGSWSAWKDLEQMEDEGSGVYGFTVTLGENLYEHFQILLDGDRSRTLHPGIESASSGSSVLGPDNFSHVQDSTWLLDGRSYVESNQLRDNSQSTSLWQESCGVPGDLYRVQLQVAGKWRSVTWNKILDESGSAVRRAVPQSKYYVVGNWNSWEPQEMDVVTGESGRYVLEVCLLGLDDRRFQLFRNMDASQILYPLFEDYGIRRNKEVDREYVGGGHAKVEGPDGFAGDRCWELPGRVGDVFRIEFSRRYEDGTDVKEISYRYVGNRTPAEELERRKLELGKRGAERRAKEEREADELEAKLRM